MNVTHVNTRAALAALVLLPVLTACGEDLPETPPRQLPGSPFHYPEELWDAGVEGETVLEIHVSETGAVDSARIERSSGHEEFDSAAMSGVRELRFEPATRGEASVPMRVLLPVQFHLPQNERADTAAAVGAPGDP